VHQTYAIDTEVDVACFSTRKVGTFAFAAAFVYLSPLMGTIYVPVASSSIHARIIVAIHPFLFIGTAQESTKPTSFSADTSVAIFLLGRSLCAFSDLVTVRPSASPASINAVASIAIFLPSCSVRATCKKIDKLLPRFTFGFSCLYEQQSP